MIPGSLPTALKALLRDMVLELKHCREAAKMMPLAVGIQPAFLLTHFPNFCRPSCHVLVVNPCSILVMGEMTCPSSHVSLAGLGTPPRIGFPLATSFVKSSVNSQDYLLKG